MQPPTHTECTDERCHDGRGHTYEAGCVLGAQPLVDLVPQPPIQRVCGDPFCPDNGRTPHSHHGPVRSARQQLDDLLTPDRTGDRSQWGCLALCLAYVAYLLWHLARAVAR